MGWRKLIDARIHQRADVENTVKTPEQVCAVLQDIAKIRRTILENAPQCLPLLAPLIIDAEDHLHSLCPR